MAKLASSRGMASFAHVRSTASTPTFQATIPDILPDEARYTRALLPSRLAYDLENIVSPTLAALFLVAMRYNALFLGTMAVRPGPRRSIGAACLVSRVCAAYTPAPYVCIERLSWDVSRST